MPKERLPERFGFCRAWSGFLGGGFFGDRSLPSLLRTARARCCILAMKPFFGRRPGCRALGAVCSAIRRSRASGPMWPAPEQDVLLADLEEVRDGPVQRPAPPGNVNPKIPNMSGMSFMMACCCREAAPGGLALLHLALLIEGRGHHEEQEREIGDLVGRAVATVQRAGAVETSGRCGLDRVAPSVPSRSGLPATTGFRLVSVSSAPGCPTCAGRALQVHHPGSSVCWCEHDVLEERAVHRAGGCCAPRRLLAAARHVGRRSAGSSDAAPGSRRTSRSGTGTCSRSGRQPPRGFTPASL